MPGVYVHLGRWPNEGHVALWGRAGDGWWGLLTWSTRIRLHGDLDHLDVAAWVPAEQVTKPHWVSAQRLPRIRLPDDRAQWPAPAGWDGWYVGAWSAGPVPLPPGVEVVTGPAWQR
jgi:hypothetical protein